MASLDSKSMTSQLKLNDAVQNMTTSEVNLSNTGVRLYQLNVTNKSGSNAVFTMRTGQSPARFILAGFSVPANSQAIFNWPEGIFCAQGLNIQADANNRLDFAIEAYKQPI
jgi:hypothetical protein